MRESDKTLANSREVSPFLADDHKATRNRQLLFCCFTSQVNSYGHGETVSSPDHTFPWASLNKQLTSTSCTSRKCSNVYLSKQTVMAVLCKQQKKIAKSKKEKANTRNQYILIIVCKKLRKTQEYMYQEHIKHQGVSPFMAGDYKPM